MKHVRYGDLSFDVPEKWLDASVITLVGAGEDAQAPNVVISREGLAGRTLKQVSLETAAEVKSAAKTAKVASEGPCTIGGRECYRVEHDLITVDRAKLKQVQYFFTSGDDVVVLSFTAMKDTWARRSKNLAAIVQSLSIDA